MSDPINMLEDQLMETHKRYESSEGLLQKLIRENEIFRDGLQDIYEERLGLRATINEILKRANKC